MRYSLAGQDAAEARKRALGNENYNLKLGPVTLRFSGAMGIEATYNVRYTEVDPQADLIFRPQLNTFAKWRVTERNSLSLGLGIGYEWGSFSLQQSAIGSSNTDFGWSGFEFANFQTGADYKVAQKVAIAPFVSVSIGQFRNTSTTTTTANNKNEMDQDLEKTSLHEWILIGVRVVFAP